MGNDICLEMVFNTQLIECCIDDCPMVLSKTTGQSSIQDSINCIYTVLYITRLGSKN